MTLGEDQSRVARQTAEDRLAGGRFDGLGHAASVPLAADPIDNKAGQRHFGIERWQNRSPPRPHFEPAERHRSPPRPARRAAWRFGPCCPCRLRSRSRRTSPSRLRSAPDRSPRPGEKRAAAIWCGGIIQASRFRQGRPAARRVIGRIDVVGPDLERLDLQATTTRARRSARR